jgi:hypothetical protein
MPWNPRHKQRRGRQGIWEANLALGENGTAPVYAPFTIKPTATPSGTAQEGDTHYNSTTHALTTYDGTGQRTQATLEATQSWTGVQTFTAAPVFSAAPSGPMGKRPVKNAVTILTAADNGALCQWGTAAGYLYTLPAPVVGLWFDFVVAVTITSSAAKVITDAGTTFLLGSFLQIPDTAAQTVAQNANGTTIRSWTGNGSTTGGFAGDSFRLTCTSTTQWTISGIGLATGSEATPFATS